MAAPDELLISALPAVPRQAGERWSASSERPEAMDLSAASDPDSGLDGCSSCGASEAPLTSEPPLSDTVPLTSEPPLGTELPLTSEPTAAARSGSTALCTEPAEL